VQNDSQEDKLGINFRYILSDMFKTCNPCNRSSIFNIIQYNVVLLEYV
jgi:hypothetical protein